MGRHYARIVGTGSYLPQRCLTNDDLATRLDLDTSDGWIRERTGIRERRIAAEDESASDLALAASRQALGMAGVRAAQLDLIIVATTTPDQVFPSTACLLQAKLGVHGMPAFDVQAVCTGFVYALSIAEKFIACGGCEHVLVVGTEVFSRILDWQDRSTCVLFGDGAGAVVLKRDSGPGILASNLHADGRHAGSLAVPGTLSGGAVSGRPLLQMDGRAVFRFAVNAMEQAIIWTLSGARLGVAELDWLILHQANARIIESTARRIGLPLERAIVTIDRHANTSAASIPLALDEAVRDGRVMSGQHLLIAGAGAGFTWGAAVLRW